jgi:serine/threonine protein kinase
MSSVIAAEAWPSIFWTALTLAPALTARLAAVWRRSCGVVGTDVSADEDYRQRFIREADLAAALWHPNIVRVNDRGESKRQLWISMEYVDGTDAAKSVRDRYSAGMPADEAVTIVTAIASALDCAGQHGLLHRDVKPANILLANPEDGEQRILLTDFGIARNVNDITPFNPKHVVLEVFGPPGAVATISYMDVNAQPQRVDDTALPWSYDITTTQPAVFANVMAQGDSDSIGCRITIDGVVKDERSVNTVNAYTFCLDKSG